MSEPAPKVNANPADAPKSAQDGVERCATRQVPSAMLAAQGLADERLRLVVEASPNALIMVERGGRITLANAQAENLFGYPRAELIGQPIEMLVPERFRAAHPIQRTAFFAHPSTRAMGAGRDLFGRRKDGREVPIEIGLNPIVTNEGTFVLASIIDITERKRAETQLREAHDQLEARVRVRTAELAAANESLREEIEQRRQAEAAMKGDQEVMGMIATGRPLPDILEKLARNIEAQTNGALCSILFLDADGVHLRHGAAPSLPEAYNRAIDRVAIGPGVGSCGTAAFLGQQVIVADIATDPLWANFKDLALRHELRACWSTPIRNADGRVLGTFAMYSRMPRNPTPKDLTTIDRATYLASIAIERNEAEVTLQKAHHELESKILERTAQLAARNDELKAFAYTVSHDLKAPLRGISGYAQELERKHAAGLSVRALFCVGQVITATKNLDRLIEDLLRYSRLDAQSPSLTDVHLPTLVRSILGDRSHVVAERGIEVIAEVPPLTLRCWERGLAQVLSNLVDNAIKYSRDAKPARVRVAAEESPGSIQLSVTDNGIGFDMKYQDRIFGLFNRLVRAEEFEGTGAGLAIVKKLIEKLHGRLWARSAPGQGATFFIELPK